MGLAHLPVNPIGVLICSETVAIREHNTFIKHMQLPEVLAPLSLAVPPWETIFQYSLDASCPPHTCRYIAKPIGQFLLSIHCGNVLSCQCHLNTHPMVVSISSCIDCDLSPSWALLSVLRSLKLARIMNSLTIARSSSMSLFKSSVGSPPSVSR